MTTTPTTPPVTAADNAARLHEIAAAIHTTTVLFGDAYAGQDTAKTAFEVAAGESGLARDTVMRQLALLADAGQWTERDIDAAVPLALKKGNAETPKTVATFIGECKVAMHPKSRTWVDFLLNLRDETWTAEADAFKADKSTPRPVAKAFSRRYHAGMAMLREAIKGNYLDTTAAVINLAEQNDPDLVPKRQAAAIADIVAKLNVIYSNFPDDDVKAAADTLIAVTEATLAEARAAAKVATNVPSASLAPIPPVVAARVAAAKAEPAPATIEDEDPMDAIDKLLDGDGVPNLELTDLAHAA